MKLTHSHSFPESASLHTAALDGNLDGVRTALESGADVNSLDGEGRNALICAVAGHAWNNLNLLNASFMTPDRLEVIRTLLEHPDITLFALNSPQRVFHGVTPLGMAAWLNSDNAVVLLLGASNQCVAVDGMDYHSATALMYAARDNNLNVVQTLLRHGARPDFRDRNHRSSIQFAVGHSHVLSLCERELRRHRCRESQSPSRSRLFSSNTKLLDLISRSVPPVSLISPESLSISTYSQLNERLTNAIIRSDIATIHSLLFPSFALVNLPDNRGWSAIHYCAATDRLSVDALDALYCAGADVSLFTSDEHYTPLHCLAKCHRPCHADSTILLYKFIYHLVHDFRAPLSAKDKKKETCIHIAAEHGSSLEVLAALLECDTTGAVRKMRNSRGLTARQVAKSQFRIAFGEVELEDLRPFSSSSNRTIRQVPSFSSLASLSSWEAEKIGLQEAILSASANQIDISSHSLLIVSNLRISSPPAHNRSNIEQINSVDTILNETSHLTMIVISHFRGRIQEIADLLNDMVSHTEELSILSDKVYYSANERMRQNGLRPIARVSEDSQATAVSTSISAYMSSAKTSTPANHPKSQPCAASEVGSSPEADKRTGAWPEWLDALLQPASAPATDKKSSGKSKLRSWLRRKVEKPGPRASLVVQSANLNLTTMECKSSMRNSTVEDALRTSHVILTATNRDLGRIQDILTSAQRLVHKTEQWISRAERVINRSLLKRREMIAKRRAALAIIDDDDDLFIRPTASHLSPRYLSPHSSISSMASNGSENSYASHDETVAENDDEETRAIRRLLLRKIDAGADGALEEIVVVDDWLRILKEVVRSVKRRASL